MNNALFSFQNPDNEPILGYLKGSPEREKLVKELDRQSNTEIEIPLIIGGKEVRTGVTKKVTMPHDHHHVLATFHCATEETVKMAIESALKAKEDWQRMPWEERGAIMLRAAELLAKPYRATINAATMLGQSKNPFQAEIDSACELIDFLRYNVFFASQIYSDQPKSDATQLNRTEYRPLEGFVYAISPFNFTSIASNLNMSPILMGNTTIWKPATTAVLSNYYVAKIYKEAGLPDGVLNFLPGQGSVISNVAFNHRALAGIHFTGSTSTFKNFWKTIGNNLDNYISYPKIVGETGGKDFIFVHNSSNPLEVATAIVRGAFEFQGQKCSAASRAYIPKSIWNEVRKHVEKQASEIKMGDVKDFTNLMNAVIDEKSFDNIMSFVNQAKTDKSCEFVCGGNGDKSKGYFIEPTLIKTTDPHSATMVNELFGPVITVYVYDDDKYEETLELCNTTSPYALTGSIFGYDRKAVLVAFEKLKYAAGNFYINDKPTGATVGWQPFGGSRASGTNDKAGSMLNLFRWTNPRAIKETFLPPTYFDYPYMR
ncbi:MAG: L-glutamate gamma-semialdehyde dehydrogenase [Bacteroidales bacterium]|nr:L-glutamate gamma-semialdehyde dehydrogenase [Bacteroidales bacterium]MDD2204469.1 L-glutamate gamma-semialdehyde dehydrogenase [Bacteroidales bacterium]MDD3152086.1 L-glutamate gamma-semialdehyde dehydrogenase [Bacteroidales bacterium]MDD3914835.1 L-glutamate gamma-semialdehyde dehydrogenase [Bacteroidales bacterium]MDD4633848.1 L-glutamate gamma-semialdehyde dehydrogenase [Bacteroidales bacterium]